MKRSIMFLQSDEMMKICQLWAKFHLVDIIIIEDKKHHDVAKRLSICR